MHAVTIIAFLAAAVTAGPQVRAFPAINDITVAQANNACGNNMSVQCCNKVTNKQTGNAIGNGPEILNGLGIGDQCSKLNIDVIGVANNLLNKECQANAACCQNSPSTATGGLINAGLPCIALSSLI
ncbi:hypothetical protein ACHAPJ_012705 [Fusarium lateritium]